MQCNAMKPYAMQSMTLDQTFERHCEASGHSHQSLTGITLCAITTRSLAPRRQDLAAWLLPARHVAPFSNANAAPTMAHVPSAPISVPFWCRTRAFGSKQNSPISLKSIHSRAFEFLLTLVPSFYSQSACYWR